MPQGMVSNNRAISQQRVEMNRWCDIKRNKEKEIWKQTPAIITVISGDYAHIHNSAL